jgi:competence protein ComEC
MPDKPWCRTATLTLLALLTAWLAACVELRPPEVRGAAEGELVVYFLSVDQGDATLLAGPDFTILIDAGRHDRSDVVPHLRRAGVQAIDLLVGTHPHADHIGQFPAVLDQFTVAEVWLSGDTHTTRTFERTVDAILAAGAAYH